GRRRYPRAHQAVCFDRSPQRGFVIRRLDTIVSLPRVEQSNPMLYGDEEPNLSQRNLLLVSWVEDDRSKDTMVARPQPAARPVEPQHGPDLDSAPSGQPPGST